VSFTSERAIGLYGARLIPREWSFDAYRFIFRYGERIARSYVNTIIIAATGTILGTVMTAAFAWPLSDRTLPFRKAISLYVLFSMLFTGGIIPFYLVIRMLGLYDTYWALILPGAFTSWNVILMRNYFTSVPASLKESATIDGANDLQIFFSIILPVSKPILATIAMFLVVGFWNAWFGALLFLGDSGKWPIMMFLKEVLQTTKAASVIVNESRVTMPTAESIRMATVIVCTVPILVVYPLAQKHFVKGIMIGSMKG